MKIEKIIFVLAFFQICGCSNDENVYALCSKGDVEGLSRLLLKTPELINCQNDLRKWTPLHFSIYNSKTNVTKYLVSNGANVNLCTTGGETAMHFAAFKIDLESVFLLVDAGALLNVKANTPGKETPLDMAILSSENLELEMSIPPETIKNYDPKMPDILRKKKDRLRKIVEVLKTHGAKRSSELTVEIN